MKGFRLVTSKEEVFPAHPDDAMFDVSGWSDECFISQLREFRNVVGNMVFEVSCSRPHLLEQLRGEAK